MFPAKIKGLNQDSSDDSDGDEDETHITKEALEQKNHQEYRNALLLLKQQKFDESKEILKNLLRSDLINEAIGKVQYVNGKLQPSVYHLKYCCYLNLGSIAQHQKRFQSALEFLLKATELDDTDLNLWYKIGSVAMKIPNLMMAIDAFMETLSRNPKHWPSLDSIIDASYAVGDYMTTLLYISHGIKLDAQYLKGIVLKDKIAKEHPTCISSFCLFYYPFDFTVTMAYDEYEERNILESIENLRSKDPALSGSFFCHESKPGPQCLAYPIKDKTWLFLGTTLINLYNKLFNSGSDACFTIINLKIDQGVKPIKEHLSTSVLNSEISDPMGIDVQSVNSVSILVNEEELEPKENVEAEEEDDVLPELVAHSKSNEGEKECEGGGRTKKRKCSPTLADQLKFCDKRRSTRNKTVIKNNEMSLSKILKTLIPSSLKSEKEKTSNRDLTLCGEDSFNTMDIYRFLFENEDGNNLNAYPVNDILDKARNKRIQDEGYFGSEAETKDVEWYLKLHDDQMLLDLMDAFLINFATKWNLTWPDKLDNIFVEIHQIVSKHRFGGNRIKQIECWDMQTAFDEDSLSQIKETLLVVLLYGELLLNQFINGVSQKQPLGNTIFGGDFCSLLLGDIRDACSLLNAAEKHIDIWLRSWWLEALLFLHKKDTFSACSALSMIIDEFPKSDAEVRLPNLKQFYQINLAEAKLLLYTLLRNQNLSEVQSLYSDTQYTRVIEILSETLKPDSQQLISLPRENILTRYQQYELLFASLWELQHYEELFKWCELACYESFTVYRKAFFDEVDSEIKGKWATVVMKTVEGMISCLQIVGQSIFDKLEKEQFSRLVQSLCSLVCHQIEATEPIPEIVTDVVTPWILLANLIDYHEKKEGLNNLDDSIGEVTILPSLQTLFIAHEHLGKRSWCCYDDGSLLFYTLNVIEPMFPKCVMFSDVWTALSQQVDQIFFCLYSHPFKRNKPRYVVEHNSYGPAFTWQRAIQAYLFYRPITLPMYDAVPKSCTISADTETLFTRIVPLVPEESNPSRYLDLLDQFLNSSLNNFPENENTVPDVIADLYYLLGDYYFQNKMMKKAIKYYSLDVCCNPRRVDSWAAMALARGNQLEMRLNSCETISGENEILKKAEHADKCFKMALKLDYYQSSLWIEYGVFCYGIHGFCSRLLKQEATNLSLQAFDFVETSKNQFLKTAFTSFNHANEAWLGLVERQEEVQDERWLHHYMLGKIAEKTEENVRVWLNHYFEAFCFLHENGAEYPMRILYSCPQHYSVETLEVYYRVHSSILKLLESHEDNPLNDETVEIIELFLKKFEDSPFVKAKASVNKSSSKNATTFGETKRELVKDDMVEEIVQCKSAISIERIVKDVLGRIIYQVEKTLRDDTVAVNNSKQKLEDTADESNETETRKPKTESIKRGDLAITNLYEDSSKPNNAKEKETSKGSIECTSLISNITSSSMSSPSSTNSDQCTSTRISSNKPGVESSPENKSDTMNLNCWKARRNILAEKCIRALEECISRFSEHYKSYYRLSHYFFRSKSHRDIDKARKLLIEQGGLFADRTVKNFFCGVWRSPSGEIDRSGSFAFHMSRSVHLLIDILRESQDYKTLLDISIQLRYKPDLDKKYVRDNEREDISKEALNLSTQAIRRIVDNTPPTETEENKKKLLLDVYKFYHKALKNCPQKDGSFGKLLISMFYKYAGRKDKIMLDQILSFCKSLSCAPKSELIGTPTFPQSIYSSFSTVSNPSSASTQPFSTLTKMDESEITKSISQTIPMTLNDKSPLLPSFPSALNQAVSQKISQSEKQFTETTTIPFQCSKLITPSISLTSTPRPKKSSSAPLSDISFTSYCDSGSKDQFPLETIRLKVKNVDGKKKYEKIDHPEKVAVTPSPPASPKLSLNKFDVGIANAGGLSITPVLQFAKQKPAESLVEMVPPKKKSSGIIITPVEPNTKLTLQQKLIAKKFANSVKNNIPAVSSSISVKLPSKITKTALGSSGVSIHPILSVPQTSSNEVGEKEKDKKVLQPKFESILVGPTVPTINSDTTVKSGQTSSFVIELERIDFTNLNRESALQSKSQISSEDKLKDRFKSLQQNTGVIIIPKTDQAHQPQVEVISLLDE